MAGILDKIKGIFGGKKADNATVDAGESKMDDIKETAGEVKDQVDDLVEKAGDKVEDIIPGDKDDDGH